MKTKRYTILTFILLSVLTLWATKQAGSKVQQSRQNKESIEAKESMEARNRESLAGIDGVRVLVEDLKPEAVKQGLTTEELQTAVELRLRQHGISVLSPNEYLAPRLYINVNTLVDETFRFAAVDVEVRLYQWTVLWNRKTMVQAITWNRGTLMIVGFHRFRDIKSLSE